MKQESTLAGLLNMLNASGGKQSLSLFQKSDEFTWSKRGEFPITEQFLKELRDAAK
jgi:hypothetical protein